MPAVTWSITVLIGIVTSPASAPFSKVAWTVAAGKRLRGRHAMGAARQRSGGCLYERCGWRAGGSERITDFGGREIRSVRYERRLTT